MRWTGRAAFRCLLVLWSCPAFAADWGMIPETSRLEFTATYQGQAVPGVFRRFDTRLVFDPQRLSGSRLEVTVFTGSAEMNSADITEAVRGADWFDASGHPEARFLSTDIVQEGSGRYLARGVLTLKGVQRRIGVPFSWRASGDGAAMQGRLILRRTDFNVGAGEWASGGTIGLDVPLGFNLKLRRLR